MKSAAVPPVLSMLVMTADLPCVFSCLTPDRCSS